MHHLPGGIWTVGFVDDLGQGQGVRFKYEEYVTSHPLTDYLGGPSLKPNVEAMMAQRQAQFANNSTLRQTPDYNWKWWHYNVSVPKEYFFQSQAWNNFNTAFTAASVVEMGIGFRAIGGMKTLGELGQLSETAASKGLTDRELVTKAAQKAENAIGGKGRFAGITKHTYANNLLSRYQNIYGYRGFEFNYYFNNEALLGANNKGFLDVINIQTMTIYDYKFGSAVMSNSQFLKYSRNFVGYSIQVIRP